jgi:hypothetical protein
MGYMKLPPNASTGSGQPMEWMTASSGFRVSQISLTPRAKTCGLSEPIFCQSRYAWVSGPRVPSDRAVTRASTSVGGA